MGKNVVGLTIIVVIATGILGCVEGYIEEPSPMTFVLSKGQSMYIDKDVNITLMNIQRPSVLGPEIAEVDVRLYHKDNQVFGDILKENETVEWDKYIITFNRTLGTGFQEPSAKFTLQIAGG